MNIPGPEGGMSEDGFLDAVAAIRHLEPDLSPVGAAIVVALHFGIASDSRAFSLKLGIEHALTLREITALSSPELGFVQVMSRSNRTQRAFLALDRNGQTLASRAFDQKLSR